MGDSGQDSPPTCANIAFLHRLGATTGASAAPAPPGIARQARPRPPRGTTPAPTRGRPQRTRCLRALVRLARRRPSPVRRRWPPAWPRRQEAAEAWPPPRQAAAAAVSSCAAAARASPLRPCGSLASVLVSSAAPVSVPQLGMHWRCTVIYMVDRQLRHGMQLPYRTEAHSAAVAYWSNFCFSVLDSPCLLLNKS